MYHSVVYSNSEQNYRTTTNVIICWVNRIEKKLWYLEWFILKVATHLVYRSPHMSHEFVLYTWNITYFKLRSRKNLIRSKQNKLIEFCNQKILFSFLNIFKKKKGFLFEKFFFLNICYLIIPKLLNYAINSRDFLLTERRNSQNRSI